MLESRPSGDAALWQGGCRPGAVRAKQEMERRGERPPVAALTQRALPPSSSAHSAQDIIIKSLKNPEEGLAARSKSGSGSRAIGHLPASGRKPEGLSWLSWLFQIGFGEAVRRRRQIAVTLIPLQKAEKRCKFGRCRAVGFCFSHGMVPSRNGQRQASTRPAATPSGRRGRQGVAVQAAALAAAASTLGKSISVCATWFT